MACSMGAAVSWQATVRPVLLRAIKPASASTSRCFMTAGSDMLNGSASALTDTPSSWFSRASNARRVESASAENMRSSAAFWAAS